MPKRSTKMPMGRLKKALSFHKFWVPALEGVFMIVWTYENACAG
jgi:hypothetical protein